MPSRSWRACISADLAVNAGDRKAQVITLGFRLASGAVESSWMPSPLARVAALAYRLAIDWVLGVEIPPATKIGPGLRLHHARGIVINGATVIGEGVEIHQGVTLGGRRSGQDCPTVGSGVKIGTGAIIIGDIHIGDGAQIGAGAVVLSSVPTGAVAVGNPARVLAP